MMKSYVLFVILINCFIFSNFEDCFMNLEIEMANYLRVAVIFDCFSIMFLFMLSIVSVSVFMWSFYYMDGDKNYPYFINLVISFIMSMLVLIFSGNYFTALVGWDGLGITSFLLVVYYNNRKSLSSGMITAITNRVGDAIYIVMIVFIYMSPNYYNNNNYYLLLSFMFVTMTLTKSAQIPFSTWLPAAMAAPTPVSALVHSSTLVTAGVYMLLRFTYGYTQMLLFAGTMTMLMAGSCACMESDIKKIVALSTLSQLGVMMVSLGLGAKHFAFFHLLSHAMFKAMLFMSVGVLIHSSYGTQNYSDHNNNWCYNKLPVLSFVVASLSLMGFPFLSGFYSKDSIQEYMYLGSSQVFYIMFMLGVGLTASYSMKVMHIVMTLNSGNSGSSSHWGGSKNTIIPLITLSLFSTSYGYYLSNNLKINLVLVLSSYDKFMPFLFISFGLLSGSYLSYFKFNSLYYMWDLGNLSQYLANMDVVSNTEKFYDSGWFNFFINKNMVQPYHSFILYLILAFMFSLILPFVLFLYY